MAEQSPYESDLAPGDWDALPRSAEGRPRISISKVPEERPVNDIPFGIDAPPMEEFNPWERAAKRTRDSNVGKLPTPEFDWGQVRTDAAKAATHAQQSWYETTEGRYYPPNAKFVDDSGQFRDENNEIIPDQKKPIVAPIARDPVTGETQAAMPGMFDIWNTLGSPASAGKATLGAGPRIPGMGHNQPPPGPLPGGGVPPPPATAGPRMAGPPPAPRQIVRGLDESKPLSWDDLYTQTLDDLHPLKVLQNKIAEHGALAPEEQFYELARLTRGTHGRTQQALEHATFDFNTLRNNGMSLKQVLAPVKGNLNSFEEYAVAVRDVELLNRGLNPGTTMAEAMAKIAAAPAEFRPALKNLHNYQDRMLQYLADSGILSTESLQNIRAANRSYVPFQRLIESPEIMGSAKNIKSWDPVKAIKGSDKDILSPLETIIRNTHLFIDLAEKNRALNALVDSVQTRGLTGLVDKVPRKMHPVQVQMKEVEKFLNDNGIPVPAGLAAAPDSFAIFRPNAMRPAADEIAVWKNGKPTNYKVDPEVANAVNGMGKQEIEAVLNFISIPARTLRSGAVLSPEFMLRNITRDQLAAAVLSKNNYVPFVDYFRGLGHMMGNSQHYQNWLKSGGANATIVNMDRKYVKEQIDNMLKTGWYEKIKTNSNPLTLLGKASEYSEQPTRIAEFVKASKRGKTPHQAGFESKEVTTDFSRHGASKFVQAYSQSTAFANPTMQGVDRLMRAFKDDYKNKSAATLFKIGAYVMLPTVATYAYNRQDPRMRDIPRQERDTFWHYPTNDWQPVTPEQAATIPKNWQKKEGDQNFVNMGTIHRAAKPFEIGVIFGSSLERAMDAYFGKHPDAFKGFEKSVRSSLIPSIYPTALLSPTEAYVNYSFFREAPLVPKRLSVPKDRKYEYTPFTTETAKMVGNIIGHMAPETQFSSPIVLENYVNGWSGTLGRYTLQLLDASMEYGARAGAALAGKDRKPKVSPEWTEADIPLWKAFVTRMPSTAAVPIKDFYENVENSTTIKALIGRIAKSNDYETPEEKLSVANDIRANNMPVKMAKTAVAVGRMFRAMEMINTSKDMDAKAKRKALDMLTLQIMFATGEANKMFEAAQKASKGNP